MTTICVAHEELAKVSEAASPMAGQNGIGLVVPLLHFGTEERASHGPEMAKGRTLVSVAITEPHAGSDPGAMKTRAVRDGNSAYVLNGRQVLHHFQLRSPTTSRCSPELKTARDRQDDRLPGRHQNGRASRLERPDLQDGHPRHSRRCADLLRQRLPASRSRTGPARRARASTLMRILDLNRPTIGATAVGLAQGALDMAIAYAKGCARPSASRPSRGLQFMHARRHP